jgi:hypothetical protein
MATAHLAGQRDNLGASMGLTLDALARRLR